MDVGPIKEGSFFVLEPNATYIAPKTAESAMLFAPAELAPGEVNLVQLGKDDDRSRLASVRAFLALHIQAPTDRVVTWAGDQATGIAEATRQAPTVMADAILSSRQMRLDAIKQSESRHPVSRFFRRGIGKIAGLGLQMIPTPIGYGPADVVEIINGVSGRNLLTGDRLDPVRRIASFIAGLIPGVPAVFILEPVSLVREGLEDVVHKRRLRSQGVVHTGDSLAWKSLYNARRIQKMGVVRQGFAFAWKNLRRAIV
ncbi:hypothetical protein HY409_04070 [Candidatus Gottesmanbacteria bacterium]|nr:hypothetical protein [Candidatus Gottesmanbacteria bacterium]